MTHRPAPASPGPATVPAIPARLEPDAIGVTQDTVIGLASSAPAATVGLTLAALAVTAAYGGGPVIVTAARRWPGRRVGLRSQADLIVSLLPGVARVAQPCWQSTGAARRTCSPGGCAAGPRSCVTFPGDLGVRPP
jgi:hypothetical protein